MLKRIVLFLICFPLLLLLAAHEEETGGLFATGLEDEVDAFTTDFVGKSVGGTNTLVVQSVIKNHGDDAAKAVFDGTSAVAYAYKDDFSDESDIYVRAYFYMGSSFVLPDDSAGFTIIEIFDGANKAAQLVLAKGGAGATYKISAHIEVPWTTIYGGANGEVTTESWFYVELRWLKGTGADGGAEVWLNGVSKGSNYTKDQTSKDIDKVTIGGNAWISVPDDTSDLYFDDVKVDTSYIGAYSAPPSEESAVFFGINFEERK